MARWSEDDIPWSQFDPGRLDPETLKVVKAAAMVERNAADYAAYLNNVFADDPAFRELAATWRDEEIQHGDVLGRYAEMADPGFSFRDRFARFVAGYRIPTELAASIRGSLTGELIARCIVETGTSSFYSALRDGTDEPVLKAICHRIAGDEFRHYKMFYDAMGRHQAREGVPLPRRALVALGRISETDDDELAYAWHAATDPADLPYERQRCSQAYAARAFRHYRPPHIDRAVNMVLKAVGLDPQGWVGRLARAFAGWKMRARAAG
ncbi:MAG: ferritin-like domain-containing protein [Solirubrobacterales bacterium]